MEGGFPFVTLKSFGTGQHLERENGAECRAHGKFLFTDCGIPGGGKKNKADKAAQKFQRQKGNEGDAEVSDQLLTVVQNADNRSVFWCENCPLPTFPAALSPLLHGGNISEKQTRQLSRHLRRYLVDYLDGNKLIEEGSDIVKRLKYNELGKWLSVTYPNMRWETVERERLKKPKVVHRWTLFIFRLRELRRRKELYGCATVPLYTDPKPTG